MEATDFDQRPNPIERLADANKSSGKRENIDAGFVCMAECCPDAPAICDGSITLSYAEVEKLSRNLSGRIMQLTQGSQRVVGIHGRRSTSLVIAVLAAVRAGHTFAILDASYPIERVRKQAQMTGAALIIGTDVPATELQEIYSSLADVPTLALDADKLRALSDNVPQINPLPQNPIAYLLFTSGTTGTPKCIQTGHAPLVHFLEFYTQSFQPTSRDRFSMLSGVGHDPFLRDMFAPLSVGAQICIPNEAFIRNPSRLYSWLQEQKISFVHATPQLLKLICAGQGKQPPLRHLKYLFSGGDTLLATHVEPFRVAAPSASIVNFYGATETPQAMGFHIVTPDDNEGRIPLGRGIQDVQLLVLTETLALASPGEHGQIAIRTRFLSDGYLGDTTATSHNFISSPFTDDPEDHIYLSGDQGYYRDDGSVVGIGRLDDQVKIRGYRVELNEVSQAIERTGLTSNTVVLAHTTGTGENLLVAYAVTCPQAGDIHEAEQTERLRQALQEMLPSYMVPSQFVWVANIPLSPNGKVDRAQLASQRPKFEDTAANVVDSDDEPLKNLIREWGAILSVGTLDPARSFVQLGGDSLSYIQASITVEKALGWLPDDWEKMPLLSLAAMPRRGSVGMHQIGTPILIRALSIVLIVLDHFKVVDIKGSTTALFIIAGWSFGSYQFRAILDRQSVAPIRATIYQILLPTVLCILFLQLRYSQLHWESLMLVSNFVSPDFDHGFTFWFLEVLVQMFCLLALLFSFQAVRTAAAREPFWAALTLGCIAYVLGTISEQIWDTNHLFHRVPQFYLWTLFLGMAVVYAESRQRKILLTLLMAGTALIGSVSLFAFLATAFVLWVRKVELPAVIVRPVNYLAISSMFIYLTHFQFRSILRHTPVGEHTGVSVIFALLGGVLVWKVWDMLHARSTTWVLRALGRDQSTPTISDQEMQAEVLRQR